MFAEILASFVKIDLAITVNTNNIEGATVNNSSGFRECDDYILPLKGGRIYEPAIAVEEDTDRRQRRLPS